MNQSATQHENPRAAPLKFAYPSGSRPLAGYTIKRGVGRGGFGEVYYAVSDAGKEVALKLIRRNLDVELRGVTHCLNLKHPHLLALYDVKQDDQENSWVVMEYVSGQSLEDAIEQHPQGMSADEAMNWMRGIAAGVAYLHDHGIVHRDLKPGNIFSDEGLVKLGDYGLAKFISCSRRSGQTESVGTVHYMAPEIANGRYGKEIDIYALGIIFYEMLTGHVPFEGESIGEVLMKHLTAQPDLSTLAEPYRTIVERALAKDPDVRFGAVEELVDQLPAAAPGSRPVHSVRVAAPPLPPIPQKPAGEMVTAEVVNAGEEPILRMLRDAWHSGRTYFSKSGIDTPTKIVLLVAGTWLLTSNMKWMTATLLPLAAIYGVYYAFRSLAATNAEPARAAQPRPPTKVPAPAAHVSTDVKPVGALHETIHHPQAPVEPRRRPWHSPKPLPPIVVKPPKQRLADLAGSMLAAAGVVAAISLVMVLLRGQPVQPEQYAWITLVSVVGAWSVMVPAKIWEGSDGEAVLRRFVLLVIGLGLGAAAFGLTQILMVDLPFEAPFVQQFRATQNRIFPNGFYRPDGSPLLYAYVAYFGFLFVILRWWRQADPRRTTRLSLWTIACSIFIAWLLNFFWPFPQPWGCMVAATMSSAIQLTSPWAPPQKRAARLAQE